MLCYPLIILVAFTLFAAGGSAQEATLLEVQCLTPRLGADEKPSVWRITGAEDGRMVTVMQYQIDMARIGFPGQVPFRIGGRTPPDQDGFVLPLPVEVVLPGWWGYVRMDGGPLAGRHDCELRLTSDLLAPSVPIDLIAPEDGWPRKVEAPSWLGYTSSSLFWRVKIDCGHVLRPDDAITVSLQAVPQGSGARVLSTLWDGAQLEWTRLPSRAGEASRVFSPFQAEMAPSSAIADGAETLEAGVDPGLKARSFTVSDALKDPLDGRLVPGVYRIRIAGSCHPAAGGQNGQGRRIYRSFACFVRVVDRWYEW